MENKLLIDIRERPKTAKWIILSLQHVFAMFGATILVPMLTGLPISVALFCSGVGTLIYIACTRAKVPVYLGSSFAYIGAITSISVAYDSYGPVMSGLLAVAFIYVILSILVRFFGKTWINKVLPPIVIGPAIIVIGLGLAGSAIGNSGLNGESFSTSWKLILTAIVSMGTVVVISTYCKGFMKVIPFLFGIIIGFLFACIVGLVDFQPFWDVISTPSQWFRIPSFMILGWKDATGSFLGTTFTMHQASLAGIITIAPLAFVTACEHIGDHSVLGKVCNKDFLQDPGLDKTLLGDGLATGFAALVGGPANTTYGENTSVIGMTRVASVWVTGGAAVIAIILSFCNFFTVFIELIPAPVMGGMSIILYGFIGLNGIKVLIDSKINLSKMTNLIIISVMLVLGLGGATLNFGKFSITNVAIAVVVGVILNALFEITKKGENKSNIDETFAAVTETDDIESSSENQSDHSDDGKEEDLK
ncbi:MAG: uracil-xanthine permease family protein [Anaeroplasmataceae bacterium]